MLISEMGCMAYKMLSTLYSQLHFFSHNTQNCQSEVNKYSYSGKKFSNLFLEPENHFCSLKQWFHFAESAGPSTIRNNDIHLETTISTLECLNEVYVYIIMHWNNVYYVILINNKLNYVLLGKVDRILDCIYIIY